MLKDIALKYFKNGYSCSESIIQACADEGICSPDLLPCATTFSGGMSSGCICGAVSAAQMVLGYNFGRNNRFKGKEMLYEKKQTGYRHAIGSTVGKRVGAAAVPQPVRQGSAQYDLYPDYSGGCGRSGGHPLASGFADLRQFHDPNGERRGNCGLSERIGDRAGGSGSVLSGKQNSGKALYCRARTMGGY